MDIQKQVQNGTNKIPLQIFPQDVCFSRETLSPFSALVLQSPYVAFTLGQTNHLYLGHGEQLAYNKVITKSSAYFDPLGSFVCRKPGLYVFHFFSLTHSQSKIWLELYRNTDYVCSIYAYTSHGYADAGNSVMLHLNEYDSVSIKSHSSYNTTLYGKSDQIYTTFTGVLLNPDEAGIKSNKFK